MTPRAAVIRSYRAALGVLALTAIFYELIDNLGHPGFSAVDYFSFFTELSNLFAAVILLIGAMRPALRRSPTFELLRGASVLYILTTGIVYAVLLSGKHVPIPWVNTVLHQVMPVVVALDWLIDPPSSPLALPRAVLWWMAFPALYILYTLVRGPLAHWYPYFFVNPHHSGGYLWVAANSVGIAVGQVAMGLGIVVVGNARGARTDSGRQLQLRAIDRHR
jgi:hypothetical protein